MREVFGSAKVDEVAVEGGVAELSASLVDPTVDVPTVSLDVFIHRRPCSLQLRLSPAS